MFKPTTKPSTLIRFTSNLRAPWSDNEGRSCHRVTEVKAGSLPLAATNVQHPFEISSRANPHQECDSQVAFQQRRSGTPSARTYLATITNILIEETSVFVNGSKSHRALLIRFYSLPSLAAAVFDSVFLT